MTDTKDKLDNDPRFRFGPPLIQTPQDAEMAYLRGVLSEDEYRAALAKFGVTEASLVAQRPIPPDRQDVAFERKIPQDLLPAEADIKRTNEHAVKMVEAKAKMREEATKAAEADKTKEETVKREQDANFVHKLEDKHIVPVFEGSGPLNTPGKNASASDSKASTESK